MTSEQQEKLLATAKDALATLFESPLSPYQQIFIDHLYHTVLAIDPEFEQVVDAFYEQLEEESAK